jgi:hypothetical protein
LLPPCHAAAAPPAATSERSKDEDDDELVLTEAEQALLDIQEPAAASEDEARFLQAFHTQTQPVNKIFTLVLKLR